MTRIGFRSAFVRLMLVGLATTLSLQWASAKLPYSERIPASSYFAVGIADTGDVWKKTEALPLTKAIEQYLVSPQMADDVDYKKFNLEKQKLEQKLGYPISANEFLGSVFKDALIYSTPDAQGKSGQSVIAILGVRNQDKAASLLKAMDERNQEEAKATNTPTSGTQAAAPAKASLFEKVTIEKAQVSHTRKTHGEQTVDVYYTLADQKVIFADSLVSITGAIKGDKPAQDLTQNEDFKKLAALTSWSKADLQGWINGDAIVQSANLKAMMSAMPALSKSNKVVFTFEVQPDGVLGQVASSEDRAKNSPNIKLGKLDGLALVAPSPMLAIVYGMLDPERAYQDLNKLMSQLGAMSGAPGAQSPLAQFEATLGISIQNELVPALGNEVTFAINNAQQNPQQMLPMPSFDLVLGAEMRDPAKMKIVMSKFEKFLEAKLASSGMSGMADPNNPAATPAPLKFKTITAGPAPYRSITLPIPNVSPSYAMYKNFVLISLNAESLVGALNRLGGKQPSVATNELYSELTQIAATDKLYSFATVNLAQIIRNLIVPMMPMVTGSMPPEKQQQFTLLVNEVLPHLTSAAAVETSKGGTSVGYIKVKMQ